MNRSMFAVTFGALALLAGCAGSAEPFDQDLATDEEADELSTGSDSFVSVRPDFRRCASPWCGGYFVRDLNSTAAETYVSGLDFSVSGLDEATVVKAREAGAGELVVKGRLGKQDQYRLRKLVVEEAFRGLPGQKVEAGAAYFHISERHIICITAPCPNLIAQKVNTTTRRDFDHLDTKAATDPITDGAATLVDGTWVARQARAHDAIVAGTFQEGEQFPGGPEIILAAQQVFLRLPVNDDPCPMFKIAACPDGQTRTYTRTADRCLIPAECVVPGMCIMSLPVCADGYTLQRWPAGKFACPANACDPTFSLAE